VSVNEEKDKKPDADTAPDGTDAVVAPVSEESKPEVKPEVNTAEQKPEAKESEEASQPTAETPVEEDLPVEPAALTAFPDADDATDVKGPAGEEDAATSDGHDAAAAEVTAAGAKAAEEKPEEEQEKPQPAKRAKRSKQPTPEKETLNISEDKNWFVVQAFSGYEASVKRSLLERIERAGLTKHFGEILVPTEEVVEIRGGQKRKSERKFFPGYVLVQMDLNDETWHLVKNVPRVLGFIGGTADRPAPISDKEADAILQRVQDGVDKPRPKVLFDVGEVVRVTDGPFNDFNGVLKK